MSTDLRTALADFCMCLAIALNALPREQPRRAVDKSGKGIRTPRTRKGPQKRSQTRSSARQPKAAHAPYGLKADGTPKKKPGRKPKLRVEVRGYSTNGAAAHA